MKFPVECKVEAVVSKEKNRPVIQYAYLRIKEKVSGRGKSKTTTREGFLEATDTYRLVRIPVEVADGDTEGFVPVRALTAARLAKTGEVSVNGSVTAQLDGGQLVLDKPLEMGQFPDVDKLLDLDKPVAFAVGLNPHLLMGVAEALGAKGKRPGEWTTLRLEFEAQEDGTPNPLRPIRVRTGNPTDERVALVMPIRLAS